MEKVVDIDTQGERGPNRKIQRENGYVFKKQLDTKTDTDTVREKEINKLE